jgi:hypothetical protein
LRESHRGDVCVHTVEVKRELVRFNTFPGCQEEHEDENGQAVMHRSFPLRWSVRRQIISDVTRQPNFDQLGRMI